MEAASFLRATRFRKAWRARDAMARAGKQATSEATDGGITDICPARGHVSGDGKAARGGAVRDRPVDREGRAEGAAPPGGGACNVTLTLEQFRAFIREAMRLARRLPLRVTLGSTRPRDLFALLCGDGGDPGDPLRRRLYLLARDGGLHLDLRHVTLERRSDHSRVWIFASGFAVSVARSPGDIAGLFNFAGERVRYMKPSDLEDGIAALRRWAEEVADPPPGPLAGRPAPAGTSSPLAVRGFA